MGKRAARQGLLDLSQRLMNRLTPDGQAAEAYRLLRTNLTYASVDKPLRTLLVTSSLAGEGKSQTALNLAMVMAAEGKQCILVDADLRKPTVGPVLQLGGSQGLVGVVAGIAPLEEALLVGPVPGLRILTHGDRVPSPAELLGSRKMKAVLEDLSRMADLVIVDSPPVLACADPSILSTIVDGTLFVVSKGRTPRGAIQEAIRQLSRVQAHVVGVVMDQAKPGKSGGEPFGYGYRYGYGYGK